MYWLLRADKGTARDIAHALVALEEGVRECGTCCNLGADDPCRDEDTLVEPNRICFRCDKRKPTPPTPGSRKSLRKSGKRPVREAPELSERRHR